MATSSKSIINNYDAVITSLLIVHSQDTGSAYIQSVIDDLAPVIVSTADYDQSSEALKSYWIGRIKICARRANINLTSANWSWANVERSRPQTLPTEPSRSASSALLLDSTSSLYDSNNNSCGDSYTSSIPSLTTKTTHEDKNRFRMMFDGLDPKKFWVLEATKAAAAAAGPNVRALSVEEKMAIFALNSCNLHPAHSMILDVDEDSWKNVFTEEELFEIQNKNPPLIRPTPIELVELLKGIKKMSVDDVYRYAHSLPHNPRKEHMKTWWSLTLTNAANRFLCSNTGVGRIGEADTMYHDWSFLSTIFRGSNIQVHGKELGSRANAYAQNCKRKLSAVEDVEKAKRGRSMDGIFKGGETEYGCMEIGQNFDSTKELKDSRLKLPIVMKDMFLKMYSYAPELQHQLHVLGYNINGPSVQLIDLDCPKGYITRIRRTTPSDYPSSTKVFTARMSSLIRVAALGKTIIEETETAFANFDKGLTPALAGTSFPPCFNIKVIPKSSPERKPKVVTPQRRSEDKQSSLSTPTSSESSTHASPESPIVNNNES